MDMCFIPEGYKSLLSVQETERAIKYVKDTFEHQELLQHPYLL